MFIIKEMLCVIGFLAWLTAAMSLVTIQPRQHDKHIHYDVAVQSGASITIKDGK